ncbi:HDOD domain-containing protein [Rhodoferax sp. AJA081-3]|uniref:protein kinase domain-containing protein n=1 Tax=Rhodoferax sp. AJA081-3 TaxID=2752316 RepID=UPI001ADF4083|nr:HDOD domain-containing protein [Rhodoferax sp. AJA081-3]QTN29016.1 HDOD domain-containing protein [Rhodoferax sp. AJA081-3]
MPTPNTFTNGRSPLATGSLRVSDTLGRFELRKILGQGAQSTVWLAFDPRMEREVAIKVMRPGSGSDPQALVQWLDEARSVGRVKHPSIVPVYEADIQDHQPYLVFEYIAGNTLDQILKQRGAIPPQEAVALMRDVLDAVAVAHAVNVVHRDLKPSNVLVDGTGRARVLDFGIAARIPDRNSTDPVVAGGGTVGYLSPEAANGGAPSASMDIFSAGVVLAELLTGKPLIDEPDPYRAIYRVVHEQMVLPDEMNADVDDRLRAIVLRALARDPRQRFPTARAFQAELEQWAKPAATASGAGSNSTLDFLLRRMRHKSDFPALSDSVLRIQNMANSDTESVNSVTNEILKDVALTNKLLRMVNSAHYAHRGSINTVSRAVNLVGFNGIRNMALSLVLLEHMQDKAHASQLKEEFLRSLMAGSIGGELCPGAGESEEAFIGAMFQNLGRLLVQFYFPEEASQVRKMVQSTREPVSESAASSQVLGLTFEELGLGIAKAWGLPLSMQRCMRKPTGAVPSKAPSDYDERMRWIALAANEIADVLLHSAPKDVDARVQAVTRKYVSALGVGSKAVQAATTAARQKLIELAAAMEIRVSPGSAAANLLSMPTLPSGKDDEEGAAQEADSGLAAFALHATNTTLPDGKSFAAPKDSSVTETLTAGIQDITNAMVEDFKLTDVLRMILETMIRALHFDHIIFCMRDAKTETMTGRFGLGQGVEVFAKGFKVPLKTATPDLFAVVCQKGTDTMISDATEPRLAQRLPEWYRKGLNAHTFLLLPLMIKGAPFGLIYADKKNRGSLELDEKELALLRTLRNQAVMAFKQST